MAKKRIDPKLPIAPIGTETLWSKITGSLGNIAVDGLWSWLMRADSFGDRLVRRLNELFREQDDGTIAIFDEEVYIGQATGINFTGAGVTAAQAANLPVGNYDVTIPGGGGGGGTTPSITAEAHEAITKGQFVAVYDDGGLTKCRVAKSSSGQGYQADGWADANFSASATVTIFLPGTVNGSGGTGLTAGDVWLGTDGYATSTPPTTAGYISQQIGVAESATSVAFEPQPDILIDTPAAVSPGGVLQSQIFTSSGTFTPPTNNTAVWVDILAGGASGAGGVAATAGNAGGSGEYCQGMLVPVSGPTAVVVGAGGAAPGAGVQTGNAGGDSSFGTWTAKGGGAPNSTTSGGGGGPRGGAGVTGNNQGVVGTAESPFFFGGSSGGGRGTSAYGGGSGGFLTGGAPGAAASQGGGGGATPWGTGGDGGTTNTNGSAASANTGAGGGGGGNGSNTDGGAGGSGIVVVYWVA